MLLEINTVYKQSEYWETQVELEKKQAYEKKKKQHPVSANCFSVCIFVKFTEPKQVFHWTRHCSWERVNGNKSYSVLRTHKSDISVSNYVKTRKIKTKHLISTSYSNNSVLIF